MSKISRRQKLALAIDKVILTVELFDDGEPFKDLFRKIMNEQKFFGEMKFSDESTKFRLFCSSRDRMGY